MVKTPFDDLVADTRNFIAKAKTALTPSLLMICTLSFTLCGAAACLGIDTTPKTWTQNVTIGNEAVKTGDYAGAEKAFEAALADCKKKYGADDGRTGTCLGYLGQMYVSQQEWLKAEKVYKELIPNKEKTEPANLQFYKDEYLKIQTKIKEYGLDKDKFAPSPPKPDKDAKSDKSKGGAKPAAKPAAKKG